MAKKPVVDMNLQLGMTELWGHETRAILPDGCIGILFVYESKAAALRDGCNKSTLMVCKATKI